MKASPMVWTGRALSGLFILFMLGGSVAPKFLAPEIARQAARPAGVADENVLLIGVIELVGTLLYAWPRTAVLGAVTLTALLGGAVASHMNAASPLFSHTLFGVYLGLIMWAGLWLRDPTLRAVLPLRKKDL
jgi:hypothetical protein